MAEKLIEIEDILKYDSESHPNRKKELFSGNWVQKLFFLNLKKLVDLGSSSTYKF